VPVRPTLLLVIAVSACASRASPTLNVEGYERVRIPPGCYGHIVEQEHNIRLTPELERELLEQADPRSTDRYICWYETPTSLVKVTLGNECSEYREVVFSRTDGQWAAISRRDVPLVLCDIKKPR
jgi:hypothetical protein